MFHLAAYTLTSAGAVAFSDMTAAVDGTFTQFNGHLIFTSPIKMLAAFIMGATVSDARLNVPSINPYGLHHIVPPEASATVPTNPDIDDYRSSPVDVPLNEEIAILMSNGAAETDQAFLWLGTPDWTMNLPRGGQRSTIRVTATATRVSNAWSADAALTFEQLPKGGVYSVLGCWGFEAAMLAFRLNFPNQKMYGGKKLFPGDLAMNAATNVPNKYGRNWLGEWGRFHTFEPPTVQVFSTAAGAGAETFNMDILYLGDSLGLLSA